jgi:hypothetical protein
MVRIEQALAERIATQALAAQYLQVKPLTSDQMVEWLKKRGITFFDWKALHFLWATGILRPIAVHAPALGSTPDIIDAGRLVPADFDQTGEYFVDLGAEIDGLRERTHLDEHIPYELKDSLVWHPYQLLTMRRLAQCLEMNWTLDTVLGGAERFGECNAERAALVPHQLVDETMSPWRVESEPRLALMLLIDPVAYPMVVGKVTLTNNVDFDSYYAWLYSEDHQLPMHTLGLSIDTVKSWHEDYSTRAQMSDPVEHFRILLQHADRSDLARQLDGALFAQELYDQARLMRFYLESQFQVVMWEEDDYRGGPDSLRVKREWYGTERAADHDRKVLMRIARGFGLDPHHKAHWIVEGATEKAFLEELARIHGFPLEKYGLEIHGLEGVGNTKGPWLRKFLQQCKANQIFVYMAVDRDSQGGKSHVTLLADLRKRGLLPFSYTVFNPDFESENFTLDELVAVGNSIAANSGNTSRITVTQVQDIAAAIGCALGTAFERATEKERIFAAKGEELGFALARIAAKNPIIVKGGRPSRRPALELFQMLLNARTADYDVSVVP